MNTFMTTELYDPTSGPTKHLPELSSLAPDTSSDITYLSTSQSSPPVTLSGESYMCRGDRHNIHEQIHHYVMMPVVILIIGTNVFILAHFLNRRYFRRPGNWFIASLCMADLLVGGASIETIVSKSEEKTVNRCLIHMGFNITAIVASILFLLAIAIDRYLTITHALTYTKLVTLRKTMIVILIVSLTSMVVGFAPLTGWNNKNYDGYCSFMYVQDPGYIVFLLTGSLLPIFAIFVIYIRLYRTARLHIKKIQALGSLTQSNLCARTHGWSSRDWRCFSRLVVVVGGVLITWTPFLVAAFWDVTSSSTPCWLKNVIGTHFLVLGMINSILNPLVYTISTRDFRQSWVKYFSKNLCSNEDRIGS